MKPFRWSHEKADIPKAGRGLSFEAIIVAIESGGLLDILAAYKADQLKSVASKNELERIRSASRATAAKDKRVNIRPSSAALNDIQIKALEEGIPYQTLIASVLHKYVTGRLQDR